LSKRKKEEQRKGTATKEATKREAREWGTWGHVPAPPSNQREKREYKKCDSFLAKIPLLSCPLFKQAHNLERGKKEKGIQRGKERRGN
jgi:hypothetical protein